MLIHTLLLTGTTPTSFRSQQHPFHILDASPFPFLTGLFLVTLLVPFVCFLHCADLLSLSTQASVPLFILPAAAVSTYKKVCLVLSTACRPLFIQLFTCARFPAKFFGYRSSKHFVVEIYIGSLFLLTGATLSYLMQVQAELNEVSRLAAIEAARLLEESLLPTKRTAGATTGAWGFAILLAALTSPA